MLKKAVSILLVAIMLFINTATSLRVVFATEEETVEESNREFNKTANWVDEKIGSEAEIVLSSKLKSSSNDTNILFLGGLCSAHSLEKETVKNAINACANRGNVDYYLYSTTRDLKTYINNGKKFVDSGNYKDSTYNGTIKKDSTFTVNFGSEFTYSRHSCLYNIAYRINHIDVSNYQLIVLETDALRMGIYYDQDSVPNEMKEELLNAAKKLKELYSQNKIVWIIPKKNAAIHDSGASSYEAKYAYNEYYLTANPLDDGQYYSKGVYDSLAILAPEDWLNDDGTAKRSYTISGKTYEYPTFSESFFNNENNYVTLKNRCSGTTDPNKIDYNKQIWINYENSDDVVKFIDAKIDSLEYDKVEITDVVNDGFTIESIKGYSYDAAKKDYVEVKNDSSNVRFSYVQDVDNKQKVTGIFNTKSIGTTNVKMVITAKVAEQSPFTADSNIVNTNKGKATAKYYEKTEYIETKEKESPTLEYPRYQITTKATNGAIDPICYVLEGDNKTISYGPNDGYELESIKVDNVSQDITTYPSSYTFSNVSDNHSIEVTYKAIPKYTITYTDGVDGEEVFKDQVYTDQLAGSDTPDFNGTPTRKDYTFDGWNPEVSEKVTGDATYAAKWKLKDKVIIEYVSEDTNKGTVSNAKDELLPDTGIATGSTASASIGYHFVNWTNSSGDVVSTNEEFVPTKPTDAWVYEKYTAHFAPNTNTAYKVEYYYQNDDGTYPTSANKVSEQRTGTTGENASITNDDKNVDSDIASGRTYVLNENMNSDWEKVILPDGSTVLKVYFKQQYTVTYKPGDYGTFSNDIHDNLDYGVNTPTLSDTCKNDGVPKGEIGYSFIGWEPEVDSTVTKNAEYVAKWSPNPNTGYKVEHYIEGLDGKYTLKETEVIQEAETDKEVTATTKTYTGYSYNEELSKDTISGTVLGDGSTVLKVYYYLKETGYTVNYYENNTVNKIAESKVVTGKKFGENVKEPAITIDGYTVTSLSSNGGEIGALNEDFNDNVINLYYYKNVSLNGNNDTVTYDGNTHEVNGYITIDDDKNVIHDVLFTDPSDNTKDFVAKTDGIYVGEYIEHIPTTLIGKVDKSQRYIVTNVSDGKLIILPTEVQNYISKTHEDRTYKFNETVTFTITVKNIYNEKHTITLQELEGVTLDQSTFIDVEPGETISATAAYKITNEDLLANGFKNVVKVSFSNISTEMSVEDDVIVEDVPTIKEVTEYVIPKTGIK